MNVQVNSFTYNFTDGQINSAQVGLYGNNQSTGEYVNASVRINQSDLSEGATFLTVAMNDIIAIAKKKLAADTAVKESTTPQAQ
ncbi:hypothetical protein [Limosilactobacillus fermentum]|jgi:hypothetical protein|uniref:Uncharacterized protein n=1 Tax=Lactobacillus phage LF1 TaxID=947980 RepID=E9LUJ7_9CAUD|nr:hypothetical protein [Limosilactobacillus fermentum]YP_007003219.1 hypothetical protein F374_gp19 [Lactobacillus phage LF1]ADW01243.1 hypothetical protein [Lactobacillus phage LF1]UVW04107.1 hypothetical protein NX839_03370 [Limosilactobacillus fermentum]WEN04724.1 hypothetical protein P0M30_06105 [Limosilactobacillus fermentum]WEN11579.1 hypothetical protein P0N62_06115 [Limosilactobacillus fermentum]WJD38234.1 hypothetical protein QRA02_06110 [Limosilactobacillus fermentum]